jgi:hypothetical protein
LTTSRGDLDSLRFGCERGAENVEPRAIDADTAALLKRQRKLAAEVEALRPSRRRDALRRELVALEKLLEQLGYRRLE